MIHYSGASLVKRNFRALYVISNKILPLGLITVFILSPDLTEVGKEMKFLSGCLGEGVTCLQGQTLCSREAHKSPLCLSHPGVWGRADRQVGAQEL